MRYYIYCSLKKNYPEYYLLSIFFIESKKPNFLMIFKLYICK